MTRMYLKSMAILAGLLITSASPAFAYIGPGLGAGTVAVVLGVIASVFLALFAVIWYPLKRIFGRKNNAKAPGANSRDAGAEPSDSAPPNK